MAENRENIVEVKPAANVYTVMMLISIVVLVAAIVIVGNVLIGPTPDGYGLEIGDLFKPAADVVANAAK